MKFPLFKHHLSGRQDAMLTAVVVSIALVAVRFFVDGVTLTLFGHTISFGHVDSASYATMLGPIAGAHGAREFANKGATPIPELRGTDNVDNPDQV